MSLAGFKKQLNKANQLLSERIAGTRGTELDSDFVEMERQIDVANKMVDELITKTQEYLQPNPMARARLSAAKGLNHLQHKSRNLSYPQAEGILGDCMLKHGKDLGPSSLMAEALVDSGEAYKQMAEIKYSLEDSVKQNFLDPFSGLQQRDLKEINHHLKKLEGRRLDYDCKKRKAAGGGKPNEDDLHAAEEKFVESKNLAENAMINFLNSDAEHVSALCELVSAELVYHQEASRILSSLQKCLEEKRSQAANRPKSEHVPSRPVGHGASSYSVSSDQSGGAGAGATSVRGSAAAGGGGRGDSWRLSAADKSHQQQEPAGPAVSVKPRTQAKSGTPTCRALFTFTAENPTELAFDEGDVIQLVAQVDENWFEGELKGRRGFFPVNYVDVIVPLP